MGYAYTDTPGVRGAEPAPVRALSEAMTRACRYPTRTRGRCPRSARRYWRTCGIVVDDTWDGGPRYVDGIGPVLATSF